MSDTAVVAICITFAVCFLVALGTYKGVTRLDHSCHSEVTEQAR